jgi:hypothetical protein
MEQSELAYRNGDTASPVVTQAAHVDDTKSASSASPRRGRGPLLWGMGGTLLSAVGFIAMILFEQYNSVLSELRSDLKHFHETSSEFVRRDSFQKFRDQFRERFKEMQAANLARMQLEQELRVAEKARDEMTRTLQQLRERLAYVEGRQIAVPSINPTPAIKK